jgi:prepilin-type N-terminal cleavage/methylation domain-containing protein
MSDAVSGRPHVRTALKRNAFTLLELIVVTGIIAILMVLVASAFTNLKSAGDVTSAAYTIKGATEQARNYAMANNTYAWIGFAGSVGSNTTNVTGQFSIAIVASNDGTKYVCSTTGIAPGTIPTDSTTTAAMVVGAGAGTVRQIGKIIKIDNAHIGDTGVPANDGTEFESRPTVANVYRVSASGDTAHTFTVQQTTFKRWIQFSPRGEAIVKGGDTQINQYAEIGLLPTHGSVLAVAFNNSSNTYSGNLAALQIRGFGGDVRIYRR